MGDQIVLNEKELIRLGGVWAGRERDATDRKGEFNWGPAGGNLGETWSTRLRLGAPTYAPGTQLKGKVDVVRGGLHTRVTTFESHAYILHYGLLNAATNTEKAEDYTTMTAAQWDANFPNAGPTTK